MSLKHDFLQLLKPYYLVNIILSLSYVVLKRIPGICNYLFNTDNCEFDGRETEILFFLLIVVMIRTRKAGSVTMISYLSSSFIYTKLANLILWFNADYSMGIIYGILFILGALLVPEPTYSGPNNVVYFRGEQGLSEQLADVKVTWIVTFYTAWNPACVNFAPIFAKLSTDYGKEQTGRQWLFIWELNDILPQWKAASYFASISCPNLLFLGLENLKFGKIDIGRYPEAGQKFHVSDSSMSKQLPTVILFQEGKEVARRPNADAKGKLVKFLFSEENVKMAFGLNNLYETANKELSESSNSNGKKHN